MYSLENVKFILKPYCWKNIQQEKIGSSAVCFPSLANPACTAPAAAGGRALQQTQRSI